MALHWNVYWWPLAGMYVILAVIVWKGFPVVMKEKKGQDKYLLWMMGIVTLIMSYFFYLVGTSKI